MNRVVKDSDGQEWELIPVGTHGGGAQVGDGQKAADDQFVVYEAMNVAHPSLRKHIAVPARLDLDDAFVQRTLFATDRSEL